MSKPIVKSISFNDDYREELQWFLGQPNKSKYICELIRKDMKGINDIEKLIEEKIKKYSLSPLKLEDDKEDILDILGDGFGFN